VVADQVVEAEDANFEDGVVSTEAEVHDCQNAHKLYTTTEHYCINLHITHLHFSSRLPREHGLCNCSLVFFLHQSTMVNNWQKYLFKPDALPATQATTVQTAQLAPHLPSLYMLACNHFLQ